MALQMTAKEVESVFAEELATGHLRTIARVADSLVRQALAGNMSAAMYYLKTEAGRRGPKSLTLDSERAAQADQQTLKLLQELLGSP